MNLVASRFRAKDWGGVGAAFMMGAFACIALVRWRESGELFFILLFFRDILASYYFFWRLPSKNSATHIHRLISYLSAAVPLFYFGGENLTVGVTIVSRLFMVVGFLISTLATIDLGNRISISPSRRGDFCHTGIYRYFKHPMYGGYFIAEAGMTLVNPWNLALFALSTFLYALRARWENRVMVQ